MKKKRKGYKFTKKKHSVKGIIALLMALLSIILGLAMIGYSFQNKGNGNEYLGIGGVSSLLIAFTALMIALSSLKEDGSYKLFPAVGTVMSVLAFGSWIAIYLAGVLL